MASIAEQLRAEGLEKGLQLGKLEGKLEGQIALIGKQLVLKFGALSSEQAQRLNQATEEELDQWATRLFTAETVDELMR